jgi:hypothetical protein
MKVLVEFKISADHRAVRLEEITLRDTWHDRGDAGIRWVVAEVDASDVAHARDIIDGCHDGAVVVAAARAEAVQAERVRRSSMPVGSIK